MREHRGTGLGSEDFEQGKVTTIHYKPKLQYEWDTGVAMQRFLQELKNGRIIARTCRQCKRTMVPPRMFCELCFRDTDDWAYVKDTGVVNTFSLCYITWDMKRLTVPEIPIVVEIDGASPGMGFLHKLKLDNPKKAKTGLKVKAVWKPASKREGSILDIEHWVPR